MKELCFLTNGGNFLRENQHGESYFQTPSGKFIRQVSDSESVYLRSVCLSASIEFAGEFNAMPVWKKLWSVTDHDDSNLIESLSSNGGGYGEREKRTYYAARMPDGNLKVRVKTRFFSTSEFFQDDTGRYLRPEECTTYILTNVEGGETTTIQGCEYDLDGCRILIQNAVLEQYSEETTLEAAIEDAGVDITSPYTFDGRLEYEEKTVYYRLSFSEAKIRLARLKEIGISRKKEIGISRKKEMAKKNNPVMPPRHRALSLAFRLAEIARNRGMTQAQVAQAAGLPQGTISRVFSGESPANSETLCRIAEAVGAEIAVNDAPE